MQALTEFTFGSHHPVRVLERDGEAWFVLPDVCAALAITNHRNATARLDEDEKGVHTVDTPGGPQPITVVSEAGLYALILTSRKPAAKRFKRWITHEVLPAIRRTGAYGAPTAVDPLKVLAFLHDHQLRVLNGAQSLADSAGLVTITALPVATGLSSQKVLRTLSMFEALGLLRWEPPGHVRLKASGPTVGQLSREVPA